MSNESMPISFGSLWEINLIELFRELKESHKDYLIISYDYSLTPLWYSRSEANLYFFLKTNLDSRTNTIRLIFSGNDEKQEYSIWAHFSHDGFVTRPKELVVEEAYADFNRESLSRLIIDMAVRNLGLIHEDML